MDYLLLKFQTKIPFSRTSSIRTDKNVQKGQTLQSVNSNAITITCPRQCGVCFLVGNVFLLLIFFRISDSFSISHSFSIFISPSVRVLFFVLGRSAMMFAMSRKTLVIRSIYPVLYLSNRFMLPSLVNSRETLSSHSKWNSDLVCRGCRWCVRVCPHTEYALERWELYGHLFLIINNLKHLNKQCKFRESLGMANGVHIHFEILYGMVFVMFHLQCARHRHTRRIQCVCNCCGPRESSNHRVFHIEYVLCTIVVVLFRCFTFFSLFFVHFRCCFRRSLLNGICGIANGALLLRFYFNCTMLTFVPVFPFNRCHSLTFAHFSQAHQFHQANNNRKIKRES